MMKVCRDCGTSNLDHHLYCRVCSSSMYRKRSESPVDASTGLVAERLVRRLVRG